MVLEIAVLFVKPGEESAFEQAFARFEHLILNAAGYLSHELHRSIERTHQYALLIEWHRLEDHTIGFMRSHEFKLLRDQLQGFFLSDPEIGHFDSVALNNAVKHLVD